MRHHSRVLFFVFLLGAIGAPASGSARADSIWNSAALQPASLYSTTRGEFHIGDILTILIVEDIRASNATNLETDKESDLEAGISGFDEIFGFTEIFGRSLSTDPRFGIDGQSEFDGEGASRRSSVITGTISGKITEILPNGNLRIEASQTTVINDEKNKVILVGTVRAQDISPQNTILSTQVANAEIFYTGVGPLSTVQKRGVLTEVIEFIWPF
ncbi:MAG: flagellar basal body L-ring protein FlgH [Candidatus Abyssubacteria bacterium]